MGVSGGISDLLQLKIEHFINQKGQIRKRFTIKEQKQEKQHDVFINESVYEAFQEYLKAYPHLAEN
jgi:integrase